MKNRDILKLVNGGILAATAHSLPVEHFYKWFKLRRELEKAYLSLDKEQAVLMKECGVTREMVDLKPEERKKLPPEVQEKIENFDVVIGKLLDEEATIKLPARIPVELYKGIYDENRAVPFAGVHVDIFANMAVEAIILETLFTEIKEDEDDEK